MPRGRRNTSLEELIWQKLKSISIQRQSSKVKPIYGNQGKAGRFRRKNGEIRHIHVWRKEKIERGKFRTPENNTVRLETRTQGQFDNAVCTNTIALRLPLILIRKLFRRTHTDKTKSLIESLYHHEASKTHTLRKKAENKSSKSSLGMRKLRPSQPPTPW